MGKLISFGIVVGILGLLGACANDPDTLQVVKFVKGQGIKPYQEIPKKEVLWRPGGMPPGPAFDEIQFRINQWFKQSQLQEVRTSDLQILGDPISHVITSFAQENKNGIVENFELEFPSLPKLTQNESFEKDDHLDVKILEAGLEKFKLNSTLTVPILVKNSKLYRAALICLGNSIHSCEREVPNGIQDLISSKIQTQVKILPRIKKEIFDQKIDKDQFWVIRFVALTANEKLKRYQMDDSKFKADFIEKLQNKLNYPLLADDNQYLLQASTQALARYRIFVKQPKWVDFLNRFPIATSEMSALAVRELILQNHPWPKVYDGSLSSILAVGYRVNHQEDLILNQEKQSWNIIFENNHLDSLISLDLSLPSFPYINTAFQANTLKWLNEKLSKLTREDNLRFAQIKRSKENIITGQGIQFSIFDSIPKIQTALVQEIRKNNPEEKILEKISDELFPSKISLGATITYQKVKNIEIPEGKPIFSCTQALCYKEKNHRDFFRILLDQHTVNYGPKGKILFYIPEKEIYSFYTPFYPTDPKQNKIKPLDHPKIMKFWDNRRKTLFHLMVPALETQYPDYMTYPYVYRNDYFQHRFNPVKRNSEMWFGMNWSPNFESRVLKSILLDRPEIRLVKNDFNVKRCYSHLQNYFERFPISDFIRLNEILKNLENSKRQGTLIEFDSNFKLIGLNKHNPTDQFPHYLKEPTPEELHQFWSDHEVLTKYYEVRLKLYSYVAEELTSSQD